jgi:hypothetical protein
MGINSGGRGGESRRPGRKRQRRIEPGQPVKPFLPVENPFPQKSAFELGAFEIIEEKDDYLICKGFDPQTKFPFGQIPPLAVRQKVKIAKPPLLLKTPWDGETVTIDGIDYTYDYTAIDERTVTWTDDDGDHEEEQTIDTPYFVGDILIAVEVRRTYIQRQSGMIVNETKVKDEDDAYLQWVDLNVSGRHWKRPVEGGGGGNWIVEIVEVDTECDCVRATCEVIRRPEGDSRWKCGDEITVYDDLGCVLNTVASDLTGVRAVICRTVGDCEYSDEMLPEECDPYGEVDLKAAHFSFVRRCCTGDLV